MQLQLQLAPAALPGSMLVPLEWLPALLRSRPDSVRHLVRHSVSYLVCVQSTKCATKRVLVLPACRSLQPWSCLPKGQQHA